MTFTNLKRTEYRDQLTSENFDVLIVGGGITGAGIALDAATRGMKVALVEMQDFAAGTSSRSTKLIHGGLRYLKQFEIGLVAEVGKERAIVYENGPHVTTPDWMMLPIHKGGTFGKFTTSIGLLVYDFLAGVKKSERRRMLSIDETIKKQPLIKKEGLKGSGYYVEYKTDDARLTIEVMKEAVKHGATVLNYAKLQELLYTNGKVSGGKVEDLVTGDVFEIQATKVINATGPWVDDIRKIDQSLKGKKLRLSKGVHIVIDQSKFPLSQSIYFDTEDGRMVFAIPRDGKTYVGTTDTFYEEDKVHPTITKEDREYILRAIHYMFPDLKITQDDIESSWSGLRPLIYEEGKDPSEISRKDEIWESESGLITIAGGKLTGYRKMAESVVNMVAKKLKEEKQLTFKECSTKHMKISGGDVGSSSQFPDYVRATSKLGTDVGLPEKAATEIVQKYGSNAPIIFQLIKEGLDEAKSYQLPPALFGKLKYAMEYEMIATPCDFFNRRVSSLLFQVDEVEAYKDAVINYMSDRFGWSDDVRNKYERELIMSYEQATMRKMTTRAAKKALG